MGDSLVEEGLKRKIPAVQFVNEIIRENEQTYIETKQKTPALCVICHENPANWMMKTCRHICLCEMCSDIIINEADKRGLILRCPICRSKVEACVCSGAIIRVHF